MSGRDSAPRLGRGLAALLGDLTPPPNPSSPSSNGVQTLTTAALEPSPFQPRGAVTPDSLTDLVASIQARGILQPLLARPHPSAPGRFQIIAGERRWRAAQVAGLTEVPVLVRPLADSEAMAAALVENLQRQDLDPIEEAQGYRRLIGEFGMTQDVLAQAVGKSRSHVANTLRLLNLPESVQEQVHAGALSAGHARALLSHADPEQAARLVVTRGLNVRQTEALITRNTAEAGTDRPPARRVKDPETLAVERDLTERLGLRVDIQFDGRSGNLRIFYSDLDQLDGLIAKLSAE